MKALIIFILSVFTTINTSYGQRIYGGNYTKIRIENLRHNCEQYDWAKKIKDGIVARAKEWVEKSDEQLWQMVPGQNLPRCIDVTFDRMTSGPSF
jgi:hypothetical protein